MDRRHFLGVLAGGGLAAAGGIGLRKPGLLVGAPRATGEPVSVTRTITDDAIEYLPETDRVRYARVSTPEGPDDYETAPFERWASRRCASVGSDVVLPTIRDRVDTELTGIGKGVSSEYFGLAITVSATTTRNRDGEVVSEPSLSVDQLRAVTPRTIEATVRLSDREHTRGVPVFVEESEAAYADSG